jgi:hypothetical protein
MGWRGTIRAMAAASRRSAKAADRRYKQQLKAEMLENSAAAVDEWERYLESMISVHVDLADAIDWDQLSNSRPPMAPKPSNEREVSARLAADRHKASFLDVFRGGSGAVKARVEAKIVEAIQADFEASQAAIATYQSAYDDWTAEVAFAKKVLQFEKNALSDVLTEFLDLEKNAALGTGVRFQIHGDRLEISVQVHTEEIVPRKRRKLLASGKLSESDMPLAQFYEFYQDYVASVALKVAGDAFHMLPHSEVWVTCETEMLNRRTGHHDVVPILSAHFVKSTFRKINLNQIDPSQAMTLFNHNMNFKKTSGFSEVRPLKPPIPPAPVS